MTSAATSRGARRYAPRDESAPDPFEARAAAHAFWESTSALFAVVEAGSLLLLGCNPAWHRLLGWLDAEVVGTSLLDLVHRSDLRRVTAALDEPSGTVEALELQVSTALGSYAPTRWNGLKVGGRWYLTGRVLQGAIAERVPHDRGEVPHRPPDVLLDELDAAVISVDLEDRVTHWNRGAELLFGADREDALGAALSDLVTQVSEGAPVSTTLDGNRQVLLRRRDGSVLAVQLRSSPLRDGNGAVVGSVSVCFDATAQRQAERAATKAQKHLRAVTDSMGEGLFALDSYGRVTVMNAAAEAMLGWSLAEIGGQTMHDVTHHRHPDGSPYPAEDCPLQRVHQDGETLRLVADVFVRRDGLDLPVTYTAAPLDTDEDTHGCVVVFIDATEVHAEQQRLAKELNELAWVQRVRQVLDDDRFELFAQPIVNLGTGEVTQHELLLRVRRTDGTIAGPAEYLTTAEEHGLIGEIDRWVIQQSLSHAAEGMHVELNISASSVGDAALLEDIERWLDASGADPALLVFEITETALIRDEHAGRHFVQRLSELGCKVALDDFGTGYGGFTYLKQLPVDYLKIDTEFVLDLCDNKASLHVVSAVVNLAHGFGLKTVAEGVEDQRTLDLLKELGVDFAQGYHIGRPGPLDQDRGTSEED